MCIYIYMCVCVCVCVCVCNLFISTFLVFFCFYNFKRKFIFPFLKGKKINVIISNSDATTLFSYTFECHYSTCKALQSGSANIFSPVVHVVLSSFPSYIPYCPSRGAVNDSNVRTIAAVRTVGHGKEVLNLYLYGN